jgi:hypothetical protein
MMRIEPGHERSMSMKRDGGGMMRIDPRPGTVALLRIADRWPGRHERNI